ncbi:MAG: xanthine dehydrogenase family protein subunit M [Chloroflexi bacterium]|nr:xanthine dehydrogenase family protein subunit M [Chloroflexota bacterium]
MKPAAFEYIVPDSLEQALSILQEHGEEAKILAGGQSLVPAMNFRMLQPTLLVDLNKLEELDHIRRNEAGDLLVGAMTRHRRLEFDNLVAQYAPLLHESIPSIAHPQIRNRGTLGGSLVHADPAAELPVIALAVDAQIKVQSIGGERTIPSVEFFQGMFTTDINPDEILVEVAIPESSARTGWAFKEIARRAGDYAMMGIAVRITLDEDGVCEKACLVYLNAGDGPMEAVEAAKILEGQPRDDQAFEAAAEKASQDEIDPLGNMHANVDFQRHLANVLTLRALDLAFQRADVDRGENL